MKFVAIDSSLAHTGIAVGKIGPTGMIFVEEILLNSTEKSKNKQVRASSDTISRCKQTYNFVESVLDRVKPHIVFAETPSGSQSSAGMKSYGATCQLIACLRPSPIEVTPTEVKLASVGNKTASKTDMINWAISMYPKLNWDINKSTGKAKAKMEHPADAIAIVHAGVKTAEFQRLQSLMK